MRTHFLQDSHFFLHLNFPPPASWAACISIHLHSGHGTDIPELSSDFSTSKVYHDMILSWQFSRKGISPSRDIRQVIALAYKTIHRSLSAENNEKTNCKDSPFCGYSRYVVYWSCSGSCDKLSDCCG